MNNQTSNVDSKNNSGILIVEISRQPIELYKILKFEAMVGSGGEAKAAVAAGQVILNGTVETQKRKKVVSGDIIEFAGSKIRIELVSAETDNKA